MTVTPARFDAHLAGAIGVFAEHAGADGLFEQRDHTVVVAVGRGPDEFNTAYVLDVPSDPPGTLGWIHDVLTRRPPPFLVQVPVDLAPKLDGVLTDLGLGVGYRAPGMVRAATADVPRPPPGLRIERVRDAVALEAHATAMAQGFGAPPDWVDGVLQPSMLDDDRVVFFNGHVDGVAEPVATAVSVVAAGVAGVYAVSVLEPARRRGIGEAMTWAAVAAGAHESVEAVVLQSSPMGRAVYERMGFVHVRTHHRYRPARPTSPSR